MKKALSVFAIALVALTFASCEKSYTCECTTSLTSGGMEINSTKTTNTFDAKRKEAKDACTKDNVEYTQGSVTTKTECKLK
jgi:hypothetical protein